MARVVFMGTPKFAVPVLEALARDCELAGVVTQPDRPAGRGRLPVAPPVKQAALGLGLPVYQPQTLGGPDVLEQFAAWRPDLIVVAAYGLIVPQALLDLPPARCVNVHASLLPRWRGAAPVAAAILAGDEITGVTIMKMDAGVDTGPLLAQRAQPVRPDDTQDILAARLSELGAALLREVLPAYLAGRLVAQPQPEEGVTYAPQLRREDGRLNWARPALELDRQVRAYHPWPGAFTQWRGARVKVLRAQALPDLQADACPGTVVMVDDGMGVATGHGVLCLLNLQLAGKRPMDGVAFVRGQRDFINSRLNGADCSN